MSELELPTISLVTPCLNQVDTIGPALDSVLGQGYPALEYVVIDGGSSDGSTQVIATREADLTSWVSQPDAGQYPALNKGFTRTGGEVMGYLNGDDLLLPGALWVVGEIFARFPEVDWITGGHVAYGARGPVSMTQPIRWTRWHLLSPFVDRFVPQESTFWRRSLWERAGGHLDSMFSLAADFELWARFSRFAALHTVDAPLGCFRFVPGQRSVAQRAGYAKEVAAVRRRERSLSTGGARRAWAADIALRTARGHPLAERAVSLALGAPPKIAYDASLGRFGLPVRSGWPRLVASSWRPGR